ncbi:S9 family peptidase [Glaciecola sp. MH2013]|uniref:alpha/beta hydrolase family protein n=1 Tax=Glaciecola sp. MH2013 TaxID=2785524 RepID=UPI00189C8BD1|nr:S9 family peptidase [Glaciecola sp. MH2013]MBF7073726.1 S9 family peptidase [Glaciecola sp. MH2013]
MNRKMLSAFLCIFVLFSSSTYANGVNLAEGLSKHYTYQNASLSPDGSKLAVNIVMGDLASLVILDLNTFKQVGTVKFADRYEPGDYWWANNERIVIKVVANSLGREQTSYRGELYAVDYNGKNGQMIYGYRAGLGATGTRLNRKSNTRGWAEFIDILPEDPKHILISSTGMSIDGSKKPTIHRLNVYNGKLSNPYMRSPVPNADFVTDQQGEVKVLIGAGDEGYSEVYLRDDEADSWTQLKNDLLGQSFYPLFIDDSGEHLYVLDEGDGDKNGLYKLNLKTLETQHIFTDETVDITNVTFSSDGRSAYAVRLDTGRPEYVMFGDKSDEAKLYRQFLETFPGNAVSLLSKSEDGNKWVVYVNSDISPGTYYLYDKKQGQMQSLFRNMEHIPQERLSESTPIKYTASDGKVIHGFLTHPVGLKANADAPLVVLVHGGPHGVRDYWLFDRDTQYLASQGYAVLRVNFRGSGGYGDKHLYSGYKHWGDLIQQDIIDGVLWAQQQKGIHKDKVCIMGASFGAYSALMSATIEPELFSCVIANAGVYDLTLMYDEGDIPRMLYGKNRLREYVGEDPEVLKAFSPINHIDKLQAPILIGHGKKDERTPFIHAERLREELEKRNKPFEWFVRSTESHGFFDEKNRQEWYEELGLFLETHLD